MRKIILLIMLVFLSTSYAKEKNEIPSKINLLIKANNNDLKSMLKLEKYYFFIHTKEGLAHYKKWYKDLLKSENSNDIIEFSKLFYKYNDLFINGETKYLKLLFLAKEKGNKDALYELLKYYEDNMIGNKLVKKKFQEIKNEILEDQSKENLERLKNTLRKISQWKEYEKIRILMEEKSYINSSLANIKELDKAYSASHYVGYDKNRLPNIINKIIESQSFDDIFYASKKIKYREHEFREKLLKEALKLTNDKEKKAQIYLDFVDNKKRTKENLLKIKRYYLKKLRKEKDQEEKKKINEKIAKLDKKREAITNEVLIKLYEKALEYDSFEASKKLYFLYQKDFNKYGDKYRALIKKLKSTNKGLKFYINAFPYDIELFEKVALSGDNDIIVRIAKVNLNNKREELESIAKKYREYILKSDDYKLHLKMKETLSLYSYKYSKKAKEFLKRLEKKEKTWKNIYLLRHKIKKSSYNYKQALKYRKEAYSYGDIKSALIYASSKVRAAYDWNYTDDKEKIKTSVNEGIKIYEELSKQNSFKAKKELAKIYSSKSLMDGSLYDLNKAQSYEK